eukprot:1543961-Pleurochrysis_carterae.AAC.1
MLTDGSSVDEIDRAMTKLQLSLGAPLLPSNHRAIAELGVELNVSNAGDNATTVAELATALQARAASSTQE